MSIAASVTRRVSVLSAIIRNARWLNPAMEIVYRDLFLRDLRRLGIEDAFYPIGSAASHGLLYAIIRAFAEFPITSVLELGCGQSTLLLAELDRKLNRSASIRSVDQDSQWADRLRSRVGHEVVVAELVPKTIRGHSIRHYRDGYFDKAKAYDLVIVDGPSVAAGAEAAWARLGCLEVLETSLAPDFIVIVDDAERKGEGILVDLMRAHLKARGTAFGETSIIAAKRQHIFCGGEFQTAKFF
jgi:predicted O-methyltransferase YrrM